MSEKILYLPAGRQGETLVYSLTANVLRAIRGRR